MKFIHSVCIILGAVIGVIQSLPIPYNNHHLSQNRQNNIDLDPAIVITHHTASILYDSDGALINPEISGINQAVIPTAPPPSPPGPILFNTNDLDTDGLLFHINPAIVPPAPPPAPPGPILYEPLETSPQSELI